MIKNFIFDTNVLLADPHAILRFGDNNIIIPITVIEEIDKFKRDLNNVGRNAREAARVLDEFRSKGNLHKGVPLENGGILRVVTNLGKEPPLPFPTLGKTADSLILATALMVRKKESLPVVFVTRDINLRLRADAVGLTAVNYEENGGVTIEELYSGRVEIQTTKRRLRSFKKQGFLKNKDPDLLSNACVTMSETGNPENQIFCRYHGFENAFLRLQGEDQDLYGITPRNREQNFAIDLLMDDNVQIVTLAGKAGTGKTLLAIVAGIQKVLEEHAYAKLVVSRPIMPLGRELGYLPGEVGEKLRPWMEPVFDNLQLILNAKISQQAAKESKLSAKKRKRKKTATDGIQQLMASGIIEVQPLTYIRGRSLPNQFLVIDESQNLTHHEVKTIITRAGEGTKLVFTGDTYQIDNPFLDASTNGLTRAIERFKGRDIAGHVTLLEGERSALAELASNLL